MTMWGGSAVWGGIGFGRGIGLRIDVMRLSLLLSLLSLDVSLPLLRGFLLEGSTCETCEFVSPIESFTIDSRLSVSGIIESVLCLTSDRVLIASSCWFRVASIVWVVCWMKGGGSPAEGLVMWVYFRDMR